MLEEHLRRRDFSTTREPKNGITPRSTGKPLYIIHQHTATHLHYDLRLETQGILKSWALPKEPPLHSGVKRLAVQTEDHPLEYANFEGEIPPDQYGSGKVEIWDKGDYQPLEVSEGKLVLKINGERLQGVYYLIKTKYKGDGRSWLFFRKA